MTDANLGYNVMAFDGRQTMVNELRELLAVIRRRSRLIIALVPLGLAAGYGASYLITPEYKAIAQLSLDPRRVAIAQPINAQTQRRDEPLIDSGRADTEVETIKSEGVIRSVVTSLDLQNVPEFGTPQRSLTTKIKTLLGQGPEEKPLGEEDRILLAAGAVGKKLTVERVDKSYAFDITFQSQNPELAAQIANAFAQTYIKKQQDADYDSTSQAVAWLKDKSDKLALQVAEADQAANTYQREAGIATSDGKLIDEQQLEKLSEQLADATAERVEAQARYEGSLQYSPDSIGELATTDSFQNTVISKLRTEYLTTENQATALATRYGKNHSAVLKLQADAKAIEDSIRRELLRYQESYKNNLDVAVAREKSIRQALEDQTNKTANTSEAQVKLKALEANATGLRAAYEGFTQRYTEAMQRQSFPVSEARVISEAIASSTPAKPRRLLFGAGGMVLGLFGGLAAALMLELAFRRIRTRTEAETATGVECFGYFPRVDKAITIGKDRKPSRGLPVDFVRTEPFSVATETLRTVKTTFDARTRGETCPVLAVTSSFPNEGKTSLCGNIAYLMSTKKKRLLLIDGDVRNPSLTNKFRATPDEVRPDELVTLESGLTVIRRADLPFDFLPMLFNGHPTAANPAGISSYGDRKMVASLEPDYFREVIEQAKPYYDNILVDLPPIIPLSDVRAVSDCVSSFVLVLAWGQSEIRVVNEALETVPMMTEKLIGSILNFADLSTLSRYGEYFATYYNSDYFTK